MPTPEELARLTIDIQLEQAGWKVQDRTSMDLSAAVGIAVREYPTTEGPCDYLLLVGRKAVGVVEAKKQGMTLSGVSDQTEKYLRAVPERVQTYRVPLPFGYESTGEETFFTDLRDPAHRSRRVFSFHRPETLLEWVKESDTLRGRLQGLPILTPEGLRECQFKGIRNLEHSFSASLPRALIQMATGSGKTFTAVSEIYRLLKYGKAKRILFLVDRGNLGKQALTEFQGYTLPDDGRKFTELYNVQRLTSNTVDPVAKVTITTIQRLYSMLRGEAELDPQEEEHSGFERSSRDTRPKEVSYSPALPPEFYDFIVIDECHRSIYNVWRQVLDYFDAFLVGLTATPSKLTIGFFNQNLVMEYSHEKAVADGVNVGYDVYRLKTRVGQEGANLDAQPEYLLGKRDRNTRAVRWEAMEEDLQYTAPQLDRSVVSESQIRTVIRTFREKLPTDLFPGRTEVPKTLIFAKDDSHAEDIVRIVREEFGKGNDFAKKITYSADNPERLISDFRNSYFPRIAVTVDMISTGTDIRALECLLFMRDVKSRLYYDQMKGRGTRTVSVTDLQAVTPDAKVKTHFVLIDAVGVTESFKSDERPLDRKKGVSFKQLLEDIQFGNRGEENLSSLASRLSRLDLELTPTDRERIQAVAGGLDLRDLARHLLDAADPDEQLRAAQQSSGQSEPDEAALMQAAEDLAEKACAPFDKVALRTLLTDLHKRSEQTIDILTQDELVFFGPEEGAKDRAAVDVQNFKQFIENHKDELTALQLLFSRPYKDRHLSFKDVQELAAALTTEHPHLTPQYLWHAYERLEKNRVRGVRPERTLTDMISLVRFAVGETEELTPFPDTVNERFERWLAAKQTAVFSFTPEQLEWLTMMKDQIANSLAVEPEDFEYTPFFDRGGFYRASKVFTDLPALMRELNEVLAA